MLLHSAQENSRYSQSASLRVHPNGQSGTNSPYGIFIILPVLPQKVFGMLCLELIGGIGSAKNLNMENKEAQGVPTVYSSI